MSRVLVILETTSIAIKCNSLFNVKILGRVWITTMGQGSFEEEIVGKTLRDFVREEPRKSVLKGRRVKG